MILLEIDLPGAAVLSRCMHASTEPSRQGVHRDVASHRVPALCLAVFAVVWIALAIRPRYREDWFLENLLTFVAVPAAIFTYRRFRFSDRAYVQATLFLILNTLGSHYTYSEVPLGEWIRAAFELTRNHYDRIVHFSFGLLMLRPLIELFLRGAGGLGPGRRFTLGLGLVAIGSVSYELLEWLVAAVADPQAGQAYLGTQGDEWDAQKDMALACLGGVLAGLWEVGRGGDDTARLTGS